MGGMHPAEVDFFHPCLLAGDTTSVAELFMKTGKGQSATKFPSSVGKPIKRDNSSSLTVITVPSLT